MVGFEQRLQRAERERDYWQQKAERLLDAALFKRQEITAPIFQESKPSSNAPLLGVISAMTRTEIDSSKRVPPAVPVTPMK